MSKNTIVKITISVEMPVFQIELILVKIVEN